MVDQDPIKEKYKHVLELLEKSPGDEEALDALISLETAIKANLLDILKKKPYGGGDENKSHVFSKFEK
ncbi:TPA: hypothetical protein DCZ39_00835 [Patescibacteria group bacterium]|nr:hypothetical protein [Candidatus Gracilibacteria bacterium]